MIFFSSVVVENALAHWKILAGWHWHSKLQVSHNKQALNMDWFDRPDKPKTEEISNACKRLVAGATVEHDVLFDNAF